MARHALFSPLQIEEIRGEFLEGYSLAEIAKRFGVDPGTIRHHCRDLIDVVNMLHHD